MVLFRVISVSSSFSLSFYPLFFVYSALFLFPLQSHILTLTLSRAHNVHSLFLFLTLRSARFNRYTRVCRFLLRFFETLVASFSPLLLLCSFSLRHAGKYIRVNSYTSSPFSRSLNAQNTAFIPRHNVFGYMLRRKLYRAFCATASASSFTFCRFLRLST